MGSPVYISFSCQLSYGRWWGACLGHLSPAASFLEEICWWCLRHPSKRQGGSLLGHINSIESNIKFTVELKSDGELPFLDVKVCRTSDGSLLQVCIGNKLTLIISWLCVSPPSSARLQGQLHILRWTLTRSLKPVMSALHYNWMATRSPSSLLRLGHHQLLHLIPLTAWKAHAVIPYVQGVSECFRRILPPFTSESVFPTTPNFKTTSIETERPNPRYPRSSVQILCAACSMVYIGQRGCRLNQRLGEHKRPLKPADSNSSALAEHASWSAGRPVDWENVSVVNRCPDFPSRLVIAAIAIRFTSITLNRASGTLPVMYDNVLELYWSQPPPSFAICIMSCYYSPSPFSFFYHLPIALSVFSLMMVAA